MDRGRMDRIVDGHLRAEERGDVEAVVEGFAPGAEHDVAGRPGGPLRGGDAIGDLYRTLLRGLRIERFEPVRRWYGPDHVVDESILHGAAEGAVLGIAGRGRRVAVRILHVFDVGDAGIVRESAWLDATTLRQQLSGAGGAP